MKKIFTLFMFTMMLLGINHLNVLAVDDDIITLEVYETTLQEEYLKYGIEFEVLDYDPNIPFTKIMLESELSKVEDYADSVEITIVDENVEIAVVDEDVDNSNISMFSMPVRVDVYGLWSVSSAYGSADMKSTADVTIDVLRDYVTTIHSYDTFQEGLFVNFNSWTTTGITTVKNNPSSGYISMSITGRATFSYADPATGVTTGYTHSISKYLTINVANFV